MRMRKLASSAPSKSLTTRTSQSWLTMRAAWSSARLRRAAASGTAGASAASAPLRSATRSRRRRTASRLRRAGTGSSAGVGEDEAADAVALAEDAPGGEGGGLGGGDRLHVEAGAEEHRLPLVDEEERRAVALLAGDAHVRRAGAGGDLPVDGAHVVAGEVGAELLELEAAAAQAAGAAAGEGAADRLARQEVEAAGAGLEAGEVGERDVDARVGVRHPRPLRRAPRLARPSRRPRGPRPRLRFPAPRAGRESALRPPRLPPRGRGLKFEEIRAYLPGDDVRAIDWKVTARTARRTCASPRGARPPGLLLVDQGQSMGFGSRLNMKAVTAAETASWPPGASSARATAVGGLVLSDGASAPSARRSREAVLRLLAVAGADARSPPTPPPCPQPPPG